MNLTGVGGSHRRRLFYWHKWVWNYPSVRHLDCHSPPTNGTRRDTREFPPTARLTTNSPPHPVNHGRVKTLGTHHVRNTGENAGDTSLSCGGTQPGPGQPGAGVTAPRATGGDHIPGTHHLQFPHSGDTPSPDSETRSDKAFTGVTSVTFGTSRTRCGLNTGDETLGTHHFRAEGSGDTPSPVSSPPRRHRCHRCHRC